MLTRQRFFLGMLAGAGAMFARRRAWRRRSAIDFSGRTVVITGGSRGFGLVLARQFAAEGANVCLLARDSGELLHAKDQVLTAGAGSVMLPPRSSSGVPKLAARRRVRAAYPCSRGRVKRSKSTGGARARR